MNAGPPGRRAHLHLRRRGHHGGSIMPHRSIWSLRLPMHRLLLGLLIALVFTGLLVAVQPWVAQGWSDLIVGWMQALALPGHFASADLASLEPASLAVPVIEPQMPETNGLVLGAHGLVVVALWVAAAWLPDGFRPAGYLLRFAMLIHGSAVVFFALWPGSFPHSVGGHVGAGLRQSWVLMLLTPWLHLATFYLFPFRWWRRLLLTLVSLAWLVLLAPVQYTLHAALLAQAGAVMMPLLHLLFGVMLPILGLVALYGWGMSWQAPLGRPALPPRRPSAAPPLVHPQQG